MNVNNGRGSSRNRRFGKPQDATVRHPAGQNVVDGAGARPSSARRERFVFAGLAILLAVGLGWGAPGAPAQSHDATQDPLFKEPYVDVDEWRDVPVRHRYVHGGFKGTDTRFSFYFPPKEQYQGRFFQYITPVPDSETLSQGASGAEDKIGFSIASGAYFIETNGGGSAGVGRPGSGVDPTIGAYRANAASAQYSRGIAARIYGQHRPYGYAYGGRGGAYRTIGGMENTEGVWDGAVPHVLGSPVAIPNVFSVRMHAMRVLKEKFPQIIDAVEPGGSGDMYAGLNTEEKEALQEVTKMGFPPKSWFGYKTMGVHAFSVLYPGIVMADKNYFDHDFWNVSGYLGANAPASLLMARIQKTSKIRKGLAEDEAVKMGLVRPMPGRERGSADLAWKNLGQVVGTMPVALQLDDVLPDMDFLGGDLIIRTGAAAGKTLQLTQISGDKVILGATDPSVLAEIKPGDEVQVDNSNFLAAQTYHRHQVPGREYPVWDQFRGPDGKPIYPQRPVLLGPLFTRAASGVVPSGKVKGKMILVESLWDREAFPWQADWFRSRVKENLGKGADDHFRLWYVDHALHGEVEDPTRTISYLGVLQQALRDLSAWVEKGIDPPATTTYKVEDGQVVVPTTAAERKGIQPVVTAKANGGARAEVRVGERVTFTAVIEVPPHAGKVVAAEWDFEGAGTFPVVGQIHNSNASGTRVTLKTTYAFAKPGTYFPALRAASQRQGDVKTPYARIQNLGRVRVVVK
jgi:hypothetical protein